MKRKVGVTQLRTGGMSALIAGGCLTVLILLAGDDTLTGTLNGGGCKMELVSSNGSVTIAGE